MRLTLEQLKEVVERLEQNGHADVEIKEGQDGRVQFYTIEVKTTLRPLKRLAQ